MLRELKLYPEQKIPLLIPESLDNKKYPVREGPVPTESHQLDFSQL